MDTRRWVVALGAVLVLTGCSSTRSGIAREPAPVPPASHSASPGAPVDSTRLLGIWRPLTIRGHSGHALLQRVGNLNFRVLNGRLTWVGSDGCNVISGPVRLGPEGRFSAPKEESTLVACLKKRPDTYTSAGLASSAVRLTLGGDRLLLFDAQGVSIGEFGRRH